jgi:hypothetical protein
MLEGFPDVIFEGHALVSADGMIADEESRMPAALRHDADWAQFQAALDRSVIVASGRKGHESHPKPSRRRLVLTRSVVDFDQRGNATWWNPAGMPLGDVLRRLNISSGTLAVAGTFDFFLPFYDRFQLSEMHRLVLPNGTPCFTAGHPRVVLTGHGLRPAQIEDLDAPARVTSTLWER